MLASACLSLSSNGSPFKGIRCLVGSTSKRETRSGHENAALALGCSSRAAHQQEIELLATLLVGLEEDDRALPLLEQVTTPGVLDENCKRLVNCAQRLGRHDTLLRICDELRQTEQQDNLIRRLEVRLLSNYAPDRAFDLAKQFVKYDQHYFSAVSNYLAVRLGKLDEVRFDNDNRPSPDDFEPEEAYLVITPYIAIGRYRDALKYAYHQLRTHFSEHHAHGQYLWLVVQYGKKANLPNHLEVVDEESRRSPQESRDRRAAVGGCRRLPTAVSP